MPQKLILPINKCLVTASYKTAAYKARFGFSHFGADMVSSSGPNIVFASGNGTVIAAGLDNLLGNVLIVRYDGAINHKTKTAQSVIARYYHLAKIMVQAGAAVNTKTELALYGNTGKYSAGAHLHIEFDYDVQYPRYSSTLSGNSNIILAAKTDTMIDPFALLHRKAGSQEIKADESLNNGQRYAMPEVAEIPLA